MKPKIEHYNYDFYAGLDYAFDLRKPVGERVVRLAKLDGTELKDGETYRLVTSNYRATGTGGYEMIGQAPTVYSSADNVQDLLIDYIRKHPSLEIPENVKFEVLY
jgi:2',3'-cyclic-nucleotide 2'-phosphodiesterase/3'-nucleotidase